MDIVENKIENYEDLSRKLKVLKKYPTYTKLTEFLLLARKYKIKKSVINNALPITTNIYIESDIKPFVEEPVKVQDPEYIQNLLKECYLNSDLFIELTEEAEIEPEIIPSSNGIIHSLEFKEQKDSDSDIDEFSNDSNSEDESSSTYSEKESLEEAPKLEIEPIDKSEDEFSVYDETSIAGDDDDDFSTG